MPRLMAEEELAKLKSDFNLLQSSWRDENENFLRFQLIANRDLQLANHVLTEKQKGDLDVLKNAQKDRERRKSVTSNLSTSKSLDAIETSAQYILIEKSELRKIQEEIAAAEERLKILEAQKESQDKSQSLVNQCKTDPRSNWRGAAVAVGTDGKMDWYRLDNWDDKVGQTASSAYEWVSYNGAKDTLVFIGDESWGFGYSVMDLNAAKTD